MKYKTKTWLLKNKKVRIAFIIFLFIGGLIVMFYPTVSRMYYKIESFKEIKKFNDKADKLQAEEKERRIHLAKAYNSALTPRIIYDIFSEKEKKKGIQAYAKMLELEEQIGYIQIPNLDLSIPIRAGTSESVLQHSIGHLEGTSLPIGGKSTHCVLTGHRGLPEAKLFSDLDQMKNGDIFYIKNIKEILAYEVDSIKVVEPSEIKQVFIVDDKDYVTLLTCTPYMINSHRLLVRGHRIPYIKGKTDIEVVNAKDKISNIKIRIIFILFLIFLLLLVVYLLYKRSRRKKCYEI